MKKGKKLSVLAVAAVGACCCFVAVGCAKKGDEHTHSYGDWAISEYPTDTAGGKIKRTCTENDGGEEVVDVPALSDTTFWSVRTTPASHTSAESLTYSNATYNVSFTKAGEAALGHSWGEWQVKDDAKPTDDEGGVIIRTCTADDGGEETMDVPKLTDAEFWTVQTNEASHVATGSSVYTNSTYNVTYTVTLPKKNHTFGAWDFVTGQRPTKQNGGKITRTCTANDGGVEIKDVPNLNDTTFWTAGTLTSPGHTTQGSQTFTNTEYNLSVTVTETATGHTYGEWTSVVGHEVTLDAGGKITRVCTADDGGVETVDVPKLSDATFWNKTSVAANYNHYGYDSYAPKNTNIDFEVDVKTANKLPAPYDNKKYISLSYSYPETVNREVSRWNHWDYKTEQGQKVSLSGVMSFNPVAGDTAAACFNEHAYPHRGHVTIEMVDYALGKVKFIFRAAEFPSTSTPGGDDDGDDWGGSDGYSLGRAVDTPTIIEGGTVTEQYGYVDKDTGILVLVKNGTPTFFLPVEIDDFTTVDAMNTVDAIESKCSVWNGGMAVSIKTSASAETMNVFIRGNDVYFNVKFKDAPAVGNDVAAEACYAADYLMVTDSEDAKLFGFGKKNGALVDSDGLEGVYTGTIDVFNYTSQQKEEDVQITVNINGAGIGAVEYSGDIMGLDGATLRYAKAPQGSDYTLDLYVTQNDIDVAYYKITADTENKTFTSVLPLITITAHINDSTETKKWFGNIEYELAARSEENFIGWYSNANYTGSRITEIKSLANVDVYARFSDTFIEFKLAGKSGDTIKKAYYADGDIVGDLFPVLTDDQMVNTESNLKFVGWYAEIGGREVAIQENASLDEESSGLVLYGKWIPLGTWSFEMGSSYGWEYDSAIGYWKSKNKGVNTSDGIMEITAVDGPINISFKAWTNSENSDKLTIRKYLTRNGSNEVVCEVGGQKTIESAQEFSYTLEVGQSLKFVYHKDGSVHTGEDCAYISNLVISGRTVTVAASPDFMEGTYTAVDGDELVLGGYGNIISWGDKVGTYSKTQTENVFDMYVVEGGANTEYYVLTVDGSTYSVVKPNVKVAYSAGTHSVPAAATVNKNIEYTLSDGISSAGYIFRGWYTQDGSESGEWGTLVTSVTPSGDTTVYGRYDAQVTITWNYLVSGADNTVDTTKYVTDSVETLQSVDGVTNTGKAFAGWFTKNGSSDGDWGEQVTVNTALSEETVEFYAKWVVPATSAGTYKGWNMDDAKESGTKTISSQSTTLTVNEIGGYSGSLSGVLSDTDMAVTDGAISLGKYAYFNAAAGIIWYPHVASVDSVNNDTWILFNTNTVTSVLYSGMRGGADIGTATYAAWFTITYKNGDVKNAFGFNNRIYFDVSWTEGVTADQANNSNVEVIDSSGNAITVFHNGKFVAPDATRGTYACVGKDDLFLNGVESFTWGTKSGTYEAVDGQENTYKLLVKQSGENVESHTVVIDMTDPDNRTYTSTENKVDISYSTAHSSHDVDTVWADVGYALPTLTDNTYICRGWYTDSVCETPAALTNGKYVPTESVTLYAKWDVKAVLTLNYGKNIMQRAIDFGVGDTVVLDDYKPLATYIGGQKFMGWSTTEGGSLTDMTSIEVSTELFAVWQTIDAYVVDGVGTADTEFSYDEATKTYTSNNYKKGGTNSVMTLTANAPGILTLQYVSSGESSFDNLQIKLNNSVYKNETGSLLRVQGENGLSDRQTPSESDWKNFTYELNAGDVIYIIRGKDGSGDKGADTAWIRNMVFSVFDMSLAGDYACEEQPTINLNGKGVITRGEETGRYEAVDGQENTYDVFFTNQLGANVSHYKLTLDRTAWTYVLTECKVDIGFDMKGHGTAIATTSVYTDIAYALPTAETVTDEAWLFRGWYDNDALDGEPVTTVIPEDGSTYTFYAKWIRKVKLTVVNGNGMDNVESAFGEGDEVNLNSFKPGYTNGKMFDGWYSDSGCTNPVEATTFNIGDDTTVYVKWVDGAPFLVECKGRPGYVNDKVFSATDNEGEYITAAERSGDAYIAINIFADGTLKFKWRALDDDPDGDGADSPLRYKVYTGNQETTGVTDIGYGTASGIYENLPWQDGAINVKGGTTVYIIFNRAYAGDRAQAGIKDITLE